MGYNGPTQPNRTGKGTANDVVMTPLATAETIMNYFKPQGTILEPCKGTGIFYNLMDPKLRDWCEIEDQFLNGEKPRDFLKYNGKVNWIITNPPFSIFDAFLEKSFEVADNVVFFAPLSKVFKSMKVDGMIREYGGIKEITHMGGGGRHGFPFGFAIGCIHYKRGYKGDIKYTKMY